MYMYIHTCTCALYIHTCTCAVEVVVLIIYEIVNFSFFALYSLLLLSFFLYLKSVPIYVIVHVHVHVCNYCHSCACTCTVYMYIHVHAPYGSVYSNCRAAWALQLHVICWKYSDLCTSVM